MEQENNTFDPKSRKYTDADLDLDERFVQNKKEMVIVLLMFCIHVVLLTCDLYILGRNPQSYTYCLGLPLYMFLMIVEHIVFIAVICLVVDKVFKDMDISPIGNIVSKIKK
jgi:uncharacterized membrane protein YhdT